jgi:hypothetical protein
MGGAFAVNILGCPSKSSEPAEYQAIINDCIQEQTILEMFAKVVKVHEKTPKYVLEPSACAEKSLSSLCG